LAIFSIAMKEIPPEGGISRLSAISRPSEVDVLTTWPVMRVLPFALCKHKRDGMRHQDSPTPQQ
jgi:hypothetical protein